MIGLLNRHTSREDLGRHLARLFVGLAAALFVLPAAAGYPRSRSALPV
jgi:hypothetical protein